MTRAAFVTGADGFIGSHLVELLVTEGYRVRALAYYNAFESRGWLDDLRPEILEEVEIVAGDIRDAAQMKQALRGIDSVFHLAALIGIPYSYEAPESYVDVNVKGTLNILQAAREHGVKVLQTSTSEVYGTARQVPIDESHPLTPMSPYAATKIAADQLALSFYMAFGLPVTVVRPFNTYGPRQSRRAVIPTIVTQIAAGQRGLRLGNLHPTRDLTFVADTARAFLMADHKESAIGEVLNFGTGHEIAIGELAQLIADLMGTEVELQQEERRQRPAGSEVERLCADAGKAASLLGWKPDYAGRAGLKRGLGDTIAWFTEREALAPDRIGEYVL